MSSQRGRQLRPERRWHRSGKVYLMLGEVVAGDEHSLELAGGGVFAAPEGMILPAFERGIFLAVTYTTTGDRNILTRVPTPWH